MHSNEDAMCGLWTEYEARDDASMTISSVAGRKLSCINSQQNVRHERNYSPMKQLFSLAFFFLLLAAKFRVRPLHEYIYGIFCDRLSFSALLMRDLPSSLFSRFFSAVVDDFTGMQCTF